MMDGIFQWIRSRFENARQLWRLFEEAQIVIDAVERKDYDRAVKHASNMIALVVNDHYEAVVIDTVNSLYELVVAVVRLYQLLTNQEPKLLVSSVDQGIAGIPSDMRASVAVIGKLPLKAMCETEGDEEPTVEVDPFTVVAILSLIVNAVRLIFEIRRRRNAYDDHNPFDETQP